MYKDTLFANGFVVIRQEKLLNPARVKRMIEAVNLQDTLRVLLECGYDEALINAEPINVDALLEDELRKTVEFIDEYCADFKLLTVCLKKFDYHNAKVFVKSKYSTVNTLDAIYPVGLLGAKELRTIIESGRYDDLPDAMAEGLREIDALFNQKSGSGRDIDVVLDKAMFKDTAVYARGIKNASIRAYFAAESDIANAMIAARSRHLNFSREDAVRQMVVGGSIKPEEAMRIYDGEWALALDAYERTGYGDIIAKLCEALKSGTSLDPVEGELSEYLFNLSRKGISDIFTDRPMFAWYMEKLAELKTIKLIVVCKNNNIGADSIKKRLRGIYA